MLGAVPSLGVAPGWQGDASLELALGQFEAMDRGIPEFGRQNTPPGNDQDAILDRGRNVVRVDARKRHENEDFAFGL